MNKQMRRGFARVTVGFLVLAAGILVSATAGRAEGPPSVADLPNAAPVPEGDGKPYRTNPLVDGAGGTIDLAAFGYVEEEYVVSGGANVYKYGPDGALEVESADMDYATRILIRRPQDPQAFSGNVHVEGGPGADGLAWYADTIIANGDAWVTINTHGLRRSVEVLQEFDPVRYAALIFPEFGQNWDIMSEVGRLLKSEAPQNPFNGMNVEYVYANGWSGGASIWWFYINEGFHENVRMPDGGPIYDGYLVGEPSGYSPVQGALFPVEMAEGDPRLTVVQPRDVPVIVLHSRPQEQERRRPDSDDPNDRYRVYEIAGATHANLRAGRAYDLPQSAFEMGGPFGCVHPISGFAFNFFAQSTLARLVAWAEEDVTPPPSQHLSLNSDGTVKRDAHGNDVGGVRSSYLDVPTAAFVANEAGPDGQPFCNGENALGAQKPFSADKLTELYGNRKKYAKQVVRRVKELERDGWLLAADAEELRQEAAKFSGF